jgi:hypothetical protein
VLLDGEQQEISFHHDVADALFTSIRTRLPVRTKNCRVKLLEVWDSSQAFFTKECTRTVVQQQIEARFAHLVLGCVMNGSRQICIAALYAGLVLSPQASLAQGSCEAPTAWTSHATVPPPDASVPLTSNCAFHLWAWQTLLWMTQPAADGKPRFLGFPNTAETFAPAAASPAIFVARATPKVLTLTARAAKSSDPFGSILQAGSDGVLIHRGGRAVYYSVNFDPTYYNFIRNKKYFDPAIFEAAPADQNFPDGALEFKYSWRILAENESATGFYTQQADIQLLIDQNGEVKTDPSQVRRVNAALVGIHVVGVVKDHPEFIWATFEHKDNAPDLPAGMAPDAPTPVSDKDRVFYRANTPASQSNLPNGGAVRLVDPAAQTLTPVTDVFRRFPWGSQPADAGNAANIVALNASVRSRVLSSDPVWQNYILIGGTWLPPNSLAPNQSLGTRAVASTRLSNATMETFMQDEDTNCLTCHNTRGAFKAGVRLPPKNLNLSHSLTEAYFRAQKSLNVLKLQ